MTNLGSYERGFAFYAPMAIKLDGTNLTDLDAYTAVISCRNEFGTSQSVIFEKGDYTAGDVSCNARIRIPEGQAIVGNRLTMELSLTGVGDDVYLGEYVLFVG